MDPKALILLVLSAFAVIILAIGAGMGQDYRSRESTNSTLTTAMNGSLTAESGDLDAKLTSECIRFFTEYDRRNCSYNYNSDDCYFIGLPEDNKLTNHDLNELRGVRETYPNVFTKFFYLRTRRLDAHFINQLLSESGWKKFDSSEYITPLKHALDIVNELDWGCSNMGCWYRLQIESKFLVNELEDFIQKRINFQQVILNLTNAVSWNEINGNYKDRLINLIIHIGDSLDISIKDCWKYPSSNYPNIVNSPYHELCSTGKRFGSHLREAFSNNTLTRNHVRPKRDLSEKKLRNNGDNIGYGKKQVLKEKEDDLVKSKEAPNRPMHAGRSYEKMRGNGNLLRLRK